MAKHELTLDVRNIPEVIFYIRREMASVLREEADAESDPRLARRLREIAALFEIGERGET